MITLAWVITIGYGLVGALLALFGLHRLQLTWLFHRHRRDRRGVSRVAPAPLRSDPPTVTVQLPIYNERYVAERLLRAVSKLRHPRERLEIQVLDDSTDDTTALVARLVAELADAGVPIVHLTRPTRRGFKAGALANGLARSRGELIAIFDADFVPPPDLLERLCAPFADPGVGMVQARWTHLNRDHSLLTRLEAVLLDGHFVVEHTARHRSGRLFNFNGTAGIWRREAIEQAGGWQHDTLTEDLDLSYRAQLAGWRFVYLPEVTVPAELPVEFAGFRAQQRRWAMGGAQTARKLWKRVLEAPLPAAVKIEAMAHLGGPFAYVLTALATAFIGPALALRSWVPAHAGLALDLPLLVGGTGSALAFLAMGQTGFAGRDRCRWTELPLALGLSASLSFVNAVAVLRGLAGVDAPFERTPKFGVIGRHSTWRDKRYRALAAAPWLEMLLASTTLGALALALAGGRWLAVPFLAIFSFGYSFAAFRSVSDRLDRMRGHSVSETGWAPPLTAERSIFKPRFAAGTAAPATREPRRADPAPSVPIPAAVRESPAT